MNSLDCSHAPVYLRLNNFSSDYGPVLPRSKDSFGHGIKSDFFVGLGGFCASFGGFCSGLSSSFRLSFLSSPQHLSLVSQG